MRTLDVIQTAVIVIKQYEIKFYVKLEEFEELCEVEDEQNQWKAEKELEGR